MRREHKIMATVITIVVIVLMAIGLWSERSEAQVDNPPHDVATWSPMYECGTQMCADYRWPGWFTISGDAFDDVGIDRFKVTLRDVDRRLWWNGSTWQPTGTRFVPQHVSANGLGDLHGHFWTDPIYLRGGRYKIVTWAWDTANQRSNAPAWTVTVEDTPYRIAVMGDSGDDNAALAETASDMNAAHGADPFDALLLLGDNVYENGDPAQLPNVLWNPFAPVLATADLWAALGNHDWDSGFGASQAQALGMPALYYTKVVDAGVRLVVLNSNQMDTAQRNWLTTTLQGASEEWVIVTMHHPLLSYGDHGSTSWLQDLRPILETYGDVDLVLAGHDHDYQRMTPQSGVTYVVSGGASRLRPTGSGPETVVATSQYNWLEIEVHRNETGGHLQITTNGHNGVLDSWTISP